MLCPVCGTKSFSKNKSDYLLMDKSYKLYECHNCGSEFWKPINSYNMTMQSLYCENPFSININDKVQKKLFLKYKLFFEHFSGKKGNLLDIGCGDGRFLYEASKLGFSTYGFDFDNKSIQFGKEKYGLQNIYAMGTKEFMEFARKKELSFDFITFFEILEHQMDLQDFFYSVKKLLKPGGYIAGSVPNKDRAFSELTMHLSPYELPPYHINRFSNKSLSYLFKKEKIDSTIQPIKNKLITLDNFMFILKNLFKKSLNKNKEQAYNNLAVNDYDKSRNFNKLFTTGYLFSLSMLKLVYNTKRITHFYFEGRLF